MTASQIASELNCHEIVVESQLSEILSKKHFKETNPIPELELNKCRNANIKMQKQNLKNLARKYKLNDKINMNISQDNYVHQIMQAYPERRRTAMVRTISA